MDSLSQKKLQFVQAQPSNMPTENPDEGGILANMKDLMNFTRDKTSARMKKFLESLRIFLKKNVIRKNLNLGFLLGLFAAHTASFCTRRTQFYRKHDRYGIISDLSTDIYILLLFYARFCWGKRIKLRPYSFSVQAVVNLVSFVLPVAFHKYYEISWSFVCFLASVDLAFLAVLFVLHSTYSDFGFFTAILGILADITKSLTSSRHPFIIWVVYGLCVLLFLFKLGLDDMFLKEEEENSSLGSDQSGNAVAEISPFGRRKTLGCAINLVVLFQVWNIFVRLGAKEMLMAHIYQLARETHGFGHYLLMMSALMMVLLYLSLWILCAKWVLEASSKHILGRLPQIAERRPVQHREGAPWTEEEHNLFLLGLEKVGKGDWRDISRNFVKTRTPTQVASHAQKYFLRQSNQNRRRRRSILFHQATDAVEAADSV